MMCHGQAGAALPVDPGQHAAQQVRVVRRVALPASVLHQLTDHGAQELLVLRHLPVRLDSKALLDLRLGRPCLRFQQCADHREYERVRRLPVERVEPVVEPAQRDGVQRQRRHVDRDVDLLVRIQPGPFVGQLPGNVQHPGHVLPHRLLTERRHQNVVRPMPHRIRRLAGEQTATGHTVLQALEPSTDLLVEGRVVTIWSTRSAPVTITLVPAGNVNL